MPYEYYDRDAVVYVDAETLFGVLSGELPISERSEEHTSELQSRE